MYALVQYYIDSTIAIMECGDIESFKPRNVANFDTRATYRAYSCGDSDTLGGYYDATLHHLAGNQDLGSSRVDLGSSHVKLCDSHVELYDSQVELGNSQDEFGDANELGGSQEERHHSQDQTVIGSSRDDGKIYAGCDRWIEKDAWGMLLKSPSNSMFCRAACLIYWTPEQLKCRSVTGILSNKYKSLGKTQVKPAMAPEKLNSLKAVFYIYMGDDTPADVAAKRVKSVRRHLAQKLSYVQRKYII
ncbi:hypothetical protein MRX96_001088 [Rhipicephalus microplus]